MTFGGHGTGSGRRGVNVPKLPARATTEPRRSGPTYGQRHDLRGEGRGRRVASTTVRDRDRVMDSSQPQKRWVHGKSEPFLMIAWQLSLLLALRNIVAHRSSEGVHGDIHYVASTVLTKIAPVAVPIFALLLTAAFALRWMGKKDRAILDLLGFTLILRTLAGFIALNVLILNPLQGDSLLLRQFLYFMPSLMIGWGWVYWRLDQAARIKGEQLLLFPEDLSHGGVTREPLRAFDYYYHSAMVAFIFEVSKVEPLNRYMKVLFLINAAMMLDLVGLVLTQAIGLASGS